MIETVTYQKKNITKCLAGIYLFIFLFIIQTGTIAQNSVRLSKLDFKETVWISPERSIFYPGDNIKLKLQLIETDSYKVSDLSKIVKIELHDASGTSISKKEYILEGGQANAEIGIPESTKNGWYYIRAYTNWMRNSAESTNNYYPVRIIDPQNPPPLKDNSLPDTIEAKIYSENSLLYLNAGNLCAVHIPDLADNSSGYSGHLVNYEKDTLASFSIGKSGWAYFELLPKKTEEYNLIIENHPEYIINTYLLSEFSSGEPYIRMKEENNYLRIDISGCSSKKLDLVIHRYYSVYARASVNINNGSAGVRLPKTGLPAGLIQISLVDTVKNKIVYKRIYPKKAIRNDFNILSEYNSDKQEFKWELIYELLNSSKYRLLNCKVSAREPEGNISANLPGLPGWNISYTIPENTEELFAWTIANSYPDNISTQLIDNSRLTKDIYTDYSKTIQKEELFEYLPETRINYSLSGRVADLSGNPAGNIRIGATILENNMFYSATTYPDGNFYLPVYNAFGTNEVVLSFIDKLDNGYKITVYPRFDQRKYKHRKKKLWASENEIKFLKDIISNKKITAIYSDKDSSDIIADKTDLLPFYNRNFRPVKVDKYIELSNIRELIYEVVPFISVRKTNNEYLLGIISKEHIQGTKEPLFLLDGIPISDFSGFLNLPPGRLNEIRQLNSVYVHGDGIFGGIASFESKNNDMAGLGLPLNSLLLTLKLPEVSITSFDACRETSSFIPSLEHTLHWETIEDMHKAKGRFKPNDNTTVYQISLSGFTSKGEWLSCKKIINTNADSELNEK